jgi:hypothetical protein
VIPLPPTLVYPTGVEYREALYNTKICFDDPALIGGNVDVDRLGMPRPITGRSGMVFTIENTSGQRWAVKCFTRHVGDQAIRYQRISEALRRVNKPWLVEFEYLTKGVLSRGRWFPALKMEWVDAVTLMSFIEMNLWDSSRLSELAQKFANIVRDLSAAGIAHGDLQHENLLVTSSGDLKLIDYDGMFVPDLAQMGACEKGHINYQSPARTMSSWGPYLDNFSAWIIYTSIVALAIDPTLWTLFHDQGDEALLLNHSDYSDPHSSRALLALTQSGRRDLKALGSVLNRLWTNDIRAIPSLEPAALSVPIYQPSSPRSGVAATTTSIGNAANSAVPDWAKLAQPVALGPMGSGAQGGASWIAGHLGALPVVTFQPPANALRVLTAVALTALALAVVTISLGILQTVAGAMAASGILIIFVIVTKLLFRRTSGWQEKRVKKVAFRECTVESSKADREVSKLELVKRRLAKREQKEIKKLNKEADKAKASEQKELASISKSLESLIQSLNKQKQSLQSKEASETGHALRALQQQHMENFLRSASISTAGIPGIGQAVARSLSAYGINTAADFSGIHYQTGPRGGRQIYIRRRDGSPVRPSGVGEKKTHDLDNWRRSVEMRAVSTQPSSLPAAELQAIGAKYMHQRQALAGREQVARDQAAGDQKHVNQEWKPKHAAISGRITTTRQTFAQERAAANLHLTSAKRWVDQTALRRELAKREVGAYRNVSYRMFLASIIRK